MGKVITTEMFVERAKEKHGGRYDYSKSSYIGCSKPLEIVCKEHGAFWQNPDNHVRLGSNCPKCQGVYQHSTQSFIEKSKEVHGDLYDYREAIYVKAHSHVKILCKDHGMFLQSPTSHFSGAGCPECSREAASDLYMCTKEDFIKKAEMVHGGWDYSRAIYSGSHTHMAMVCPEGHKVRQTPTKHLTGGCRVCSDLNSQGFLNKTILDRDPELSQKPATFYHIQLTHKDSEETFQKVGISTNPKERFSAYGPYKVTKTLSIVTGVLEDMLDLEQLTLGEIKESKLRYIPKEKFGGYTECFRSLINEL